MRLATLQLAPVFLSFFAAAPQLAAQNLQLDQVGGGIGGTTQLQVQGSAGSFYVVLFDVMEQSTSLPALGVTLDIRPIFSGVSFSLPGFSGLIGSNGTATASVGIPNDPNLASLVLSLQTLTLGSLCEVSNLVRLTPQESGTFAPTLGQPALPIQGGGVFAGANGELLFAGGSGPVAQTYLSRTEEWELSGATFGVGILSQSTALADGRVLFTGGMDLLTGQPTAAAALYDPATQQTTTLTMASARAGHGASLLSNGKVLISGGLNAYDLTNPLSLFSGILNSTELFDPTTNSFSSGPAMLEARALHTSTRLTNGNVLVAGGISVIPIVNVPTVSATAYRYNPSTNSFGLPALMSGGRMLHSAVALDNGKVLLCGGLTLDLTTFLQTLQIQDLIVGTRDDCVVYTPSLFGFGTFATVTGMQEGRAGAALAALPGGQALMAGGFRLTIDVPNSTFNIGWTETADRFAANSIAPTGSMQSPRIFPLAVNLPDGTVMLVGGGAANEVYQR